MDDVLSGDINPTIGHGEIAETDELGEDGKRRSVVTATQFSNMGTVQTG